jgi:hypothetical protein
LSRTRRLFVRHLSFSLVGRTTLSALWVGLAFAPGCATKTAPPPAPPAPGPVAVVRDRDSGPFALDAQRFLARDAAIAVKEGAGPLSVVAADVGSDGDRVGSFVRTPKEGCLLAYARGSDGVDDLDLFAYSDDGTPLVVDEAPDPNPAVLLCSPQPVRAYLAARVVAGRGIVAVGAHVVPTEAVPRVVEALRVRGGPTEAGQAEIWPGLDAKVAEARRDWGGSWEETRRVALPLDPRAPTGISTSVEAGRCVSFFVTPAEEVNQVDLSLLDGEGRLVGRALERGRDRAAVVCSSVQTTLTAELRPHAGAGMAAIVIARARAGTEADLIGVAERLDAFPSRELGVARTALTQRLAAAGYGAASAQAAGRAEAGRKTSISVPVTKGCSRVDVVAGSPLAGVSVDAWDENGLLLAREEGGHGVTFFVCGDAGKVRVDAEATSRPGPFAIEVHVEKRPPAALVAGGLAGGRLLGRLHARGEIIPAERLTEVHTGRLSDEKLESIELAIPAKRCADIAVGLGRGVSGVDLRILDAGSGDELGMGRGVVSAAARACSETTNRPVRIELRTSAGSGEFLRAIRWSPLPPPP